MSSNVNSVIHNMQGLSAQRYLGITNNSRAKTTEKLASGFRINRAADDAAGLAISEKMRRIIRGLTRGTENAQDGVSLCQIADGALEEVSDMLHRITELSIQSANDTNNPEDRQAIQSEISQILTEIDRISETTVFNEQKIFADNSTKELVLSPYEQAKKDLLTGTYRTVDDVTLKDGQTIDRDTANSTIRLLSDLAILGEAHNICEENKDKYPDRYRLVMGEVQDYIIENRSTIMSNTSPLYPYAESDDYTTYMENSERWVNKALAKDKADYEFDHAINYTLDLYAMAMNYDRTHRTDTGYYIGEGLFYTDSLMINSGRTMNIPYEQQIGTAMGGFTNAIKGVLEKSGINSGDLYDQIKDNTTVVDALYERLSPDKDGLEIAIDMYMKLAGLEDQSEEKNLHKKSFWIQSGAEKDDGLWLEYGEMNTEILGIKGLDVSTGSGAKKSISKVKDALSYVSSLRSTIGAQQNRLTHTIDNQNNVIENTQAAESRIRDADMSKETVNYSKDNILMQAGQAMLAQANQSKQGLLSLLQ